MEQDELLDQPPLPKKKFSKGPLLYTFVSICLTGFLLKRFHAPFGGELIVFGGGVSVGYITALLTRFTQHYLFENVGFLLYCAFITFSVIYTFIPLAWWLYFGSMAVSLLVFFFILREKEID